MNQLQRHFIKELSYSLRRYYVDEFYLRRITDVKQTSAVLDLGGDRVGKRGAFDLNRYHAKAVYANLSRDKKPDVQCGAECIPFRSNTFDVVICSEVLEHVREPLAVLTEIFRVLRNQGIVLICVPFLNRIHADPCDYGRYTDYYWVEMLDKIGFQEINVEWQGGFWSVLVEMLRYFVSAKSSSWGTDQAWLIRLMSYVFFWLKMAAVAWEGKGGFQTRPYNASLGFTTGFGVKAVRP